MSPHKPAPFLGLLLALALNHPSAMAQTWNQTATGTYSWNDSGNWSAAFPNAIGASADLRANLTGDQLINLNQVTTVGTLRLGDPTSTYHGITIAPNGGSLTFDVASGNALLEKLTVAGASAVVDTISANITLNDNWNVNVGQSTDPGNNVPTAHAVTISGNISGAGRTLTKTRSGTLNLNGATTLGSLSIGVQVGANRGGSIVVGSGGTLSIGAGTGNFVDIGGGGGTSYGFGTVDASASTSFTANVGNFYVGYSTRGNGDSQSGGTLNLGADNSITATTVIFGQATAANGAGGTRTITTANNSATTINTGSMNLAIGGVNTSTFTLGTNASLILRGQSGAGTRTSLTIGNNNVAWGSSGGNMNLSAGAAQLYLNQLVVGKTTNTGNLANSQLSLSTSNLNHLDISAASGNAVQIGYSSSANNAIGTVTIGNLNSTSAIATSDASAAAILIGYKGGGGAATGTLSINGGTLKITTGGGAAIAGGGGTSTLNLAGGATLIAGNNHSNWIAGLSAANINAGGVTIDTDGKSIGISQKLDGAGGLTKDGAGTLTLSTGTTHGYTGATYVTEGTLVVDGNISTSSLTTIGNGTDAATLEGIGTVGDLTISTNAFHNPGNSPGIMNTGDYTMAGTLNIEIDGLTPGVGGHDQINVSGSVNISGSLVTDFGGGSYANGNMIFILLNDGADSITDTFAGLAQGDYVTSYGGFDWIISYLADSDTPSFTGGNDVALMAVTVIPEPAAAILGSIGMVILLRRRRA